MTPLQPSNKHVRTAAERVKVHVSLALLESLSELPPRWSELREMPKNQVKDSQGLYSHIHTGSRGPLLLGTSFSANANRMQGGT